MKRHHGATAGAALLAMLCVALATGCGKDDSLTSPASSTGTNDVSGTAATAFDALAFDMQAGDTLARGPMNPFGLPIGIPAGCGFDAATVSYICMSAHDGLTDEHGYQFLDATGAAQSAYDGITTASIRFQSHLYGTTTRPPISIVDATRSLVVSGMEGDEASRTWNGNGNSSRQDSVHAPDGSLHVVKRLSTTRVADVVIPKPWLRDSWPLSGTITTNLQETGGLRDRTLTSVLTFNGTRYATMTVNDSTFTIDLAAPPCGGPGGGNQPPPPPPGGGAGGGPPPPPPPDGGTGGK